MEMVEDKPITLVLATPAERINSKHLEVKRLELTAKDVAAEVGEMLIEVKQSLPHGEFMQWVEAHCSFSYDTAKNYVKVAKAKRERATYFNKCTSIREVLELGKPEDSRKNYEPKQPKPKMDKDDQRKVRKLQAIIDDHAADPNTVEACKRKLDGYKTAHGEKAVEDYLESVSVVDEDEDLDIFGLKREAAATERLDQIMEWLREGLHKKEVEDILYCVFIDAYNPLDDDEGLEKLSVVYKEIKTEMEN